MNPARLAQLARQWPRPESPPPAFRRGDRVTLLDGGVGWVWQVRGVSALVLRGAAPERLLQVDDADGDALPIGPLSSGTVATWELLEDLHPAAG